MLRHQDIEIGIFEQCDSLNLLGCDFRRFDFAAVDGRQPRSSQRLPTDHHIANLRIENYRGRSLIQSNQGRRDTWIIDSHKSFQSSNSNLLLFVGRNQPQQRFDERGFRPLRQDSQARDLSVGVCPRIRNLANDNVI